MPATTNGAGARSASPAPQTTPAVPLSVRPFGPHLTIPTAVMLAVLLVLAVAASPAVATFVAGALVGWVA